MKNINIAIAVVFLIALVGSILTLMFEEAEAPTEVACNTEARICPDGTTVGRTAPNCEFAPCPQPPIPDDLQAHIDSKKNLIVLESPTPGSIVTSPITITGKARGYWYFEASFPITIVNWNGLIIGEGIAQAQGDWMTEDFVPFSATLTYDFPEDTPYRRGAIILQKDNPSGLPENDDALEVPIEF
jgi:hypothetical protein